MPFRYGICNPTNDAKAIQFKDSFSSCLKATAMEKGKKIAIKKLITGLALASYPTDQINTL